MTLNEYYDRLDQATRTFVVTADVRAMRQLKTVEHPALHLDHADETSALPCWRIVSRSSLGIRDPEELRADAVVGIDPRNLLRRLAFDDLAATKAKYIRLLALWADEPWQLHSDGAAPQRRFRLVSP